MSTCTLPSIPSKLLQIAFDDTKKARKSEKYRLNMGVYHNGEPGAVFICEVCVAGAVMAFTLGASSSDRLKPHHFPGCASQLRAIDAFRSGYICEALRSLGIINKGDSEKRLALSNAHSEAMWNPEPNYRAWSTAWRKFIRVCKELGY